MILDTQKEESILMKNIVSLIKESNDVFNTAVISMGSVSKIFMDHTGRCDDSLIHQPSLINEFLS